MERSVLRKVCEIRGILGKLQRNVHHRIPSAMTGYSERFQPRTTKVVQTTEDVAEKHLSDNDHVNILFENRNPRNLEKLSLGRKPKGWTLDYPTRQYWHKIFLDQSVSHITARIEHFNGTTVVSASTQEQSIRKHLYSTADVAAAENIGRVIAQRSLESGIIWVHVHFTPEEQISEKVKSFIKALESGGLRLEEPNRLYPFRDWH